MKFKILFLLITFNISLTTSWAATVTLNNSPANPSTGITDTNYYCVVASDTTCPTLPWSMSTKTTVAGAATGGTVILPAITGQTICCYGTFQAGALESVPSNVVSGVVPPKGMVIVGPLTIL